MKYRWMGSVNSIKYLSEEIVFLFTIKMEGWESKKVVVSQQWYRDKNIMSLHPSIHFYNQRWLIFTFIIC